MTSALTEDHRAPVIWTLDCWILDVHYRILRYDFGFVFHAIGFDKPKPETYTTADLLVERLYATSDRAFNIEFSEPIPRAHELYKPYHRRYSSADFRLNTLRSDKRSIGHCQCFACAYGCCLEARAHDRHIVDDEVVLYTSRPDLKVLNQQVSLTERAFTDADEPGCVDVLSACLPIRGVLSIILSYVQQYFLTWRDFIALVNRRFKARRGAGCTAEMMGQMHMYFHVKMTDDEASLSFIPMFSEGLNSVKS